MIDSTSTANASATQAGVSADQVGGANPVAPAEAEPTAAGETAPETEVGSGSRPNSPQAGASTQVAVRAESALHTDKGTTTIAEGVVAKIVGMAAREVAGIHSMGSATGRAMGAVRDLLPGSSPSVTEGVTVEVGSTQAAADLSIVTIYGAPIQDVAQAVRDNVIRRVQEMTGLEVVEVNIAVTDVNLPVDGASTDQAGPAQPSTHQRVQ